MAGALKFTYSFKKGEFPKAMKDMYRPIAKTATRGMTELARSWKGASRRDVGKHFSIKWQNAVRVQAFPKLPKSSADAAAFLNHRVTYADVFEKGDRKSVV